MKKEEKQIKLSCDDGKISSKMSLSDFTDLFDDSSNPLNKSLDLKPNNLNLVELSYYLNFLMKDEIIVNKTINELTDLVATGDIQITYLPIYRNVKNKVCGIYEFCSLPKLKELSNKNIGIVLYTILIDETNNVRYGCSVDDKD